jgi:hypothetical protein
MEGIFSTIIILFLILFDLLEPIFRRKDLFFNVEINQEKKSGKKIYRNYAKKVLLITLPVGIILWYYYPIERNLFAFLSGFLVMILLNLFFYFIARKEVKGLYNKK